MELKKIVLASERKKWNSQNTPLELRTANGECRSVYRVVVEIQKNASNFEWIQALCLDGVWFFQILVERVKPKSEK